MAYINVSGTGNFATLQISTATITALNSTTDIIVPAMQNITVNNANASYRWKQLDSTSENVITTAATNQVTTNIVLDPTAFFGDGSGDVTAVDKGIFKLSNDKVQVYFRVYWSGTGQGDKYVTGTGFISGVAPTVSADQPIWTSPLTIDVVGDYTQGTVA